MPMQLQSFQVGKLYSNDEIYRSLGVGNAGGIRSNSEDGGTRRLVVMTSLSDAKSRVENPYHDRLEGDVLVYTGAGKVGDQSLSGQNARIPRQVAEQFPIWCFQKQRSRRDKTSGPKRWKFLGLLHFLRTFLELQVDSVGESRQAHVFEFQVLSAMTEVAVDLDRELSATLIEEAEIEAPIEPSDREVELVEPSPLDVSQLEAVRRTLLRQEPEEFETTIGELLKRTGFQDVEVTRYSQDGGIDINARPNANAWPLRHLLLQVQAKRWLHTVGRREVAELRGSILPHAAGCIVTTSHFSRAAIIESTSESKVPITLVNGRELAGLVMNTGLSV